MDKGVRMTKELMLGRATALAALIGGLAACSGGGGGELGAPAAGTSGTAGAAALTVSLMDAPVDDVIEVNVHITSIWIKPEEGPPVEIELEDGPKTVNLLAHGADNAAVLLDGAVIEAGQYEWLAMDVDDSYPMSYVVSDALGTWEELTVPSDRLRLVNGFEVETNESVEFLLDWDLRKALVNPPGLGSYLLKPAFRVIDLQHHGAISGSVDVTTVMLPDNDCNADSLVDEDYDVGNTVYIFSGLGVTPDDIDEIDPEIDPEPLATVDLELSDDSMRYEYSTVLPFGDYTVAFTCQAANDAAETNELGNDDPEDDTLAFFAPAQDVTLGGAGGASAVVDFDPPSP
jgi:hypothetical protein